ncbi:MAG: hypothetical protein LBG70_01480 [Bifidobacteriaceae bacterium]|jgi:hypothetical protein|nr:hypothetical protein [Bifidobacteriaceae bacterium]
MCVYEHAITITYASATRRFATALASLLLLVSVAACAGSPIDGGPLEAGTDELESIMFEMCPATAEHSRGIGWEVIKNTDPRSSVILDSVQLLEADSVRLQESYIIPLSDDQTNVYGGGSELPPVDDGLSAKQLEFWKQRIPLAGATIPPLGSANILLGVIDQPDGKQRVLGAQINYHINGSYYRVLSGVGGSFLPQDHQLCKESD